MDFIHPHVVSRTLASASQSLSSLGVIVYKKLIFIFTLYSPINVTDITFNYNIRPGVTNIISKFQCPYRQLLHIYVTMFAKESLATGYSIPFIVFPFHSILDPIFTESLYGVRCCY